MRRRRFCNSATRVTASILLSILTVTSAAELPILPPPPTTPTPRDSPTREFSLKHIFHHGTYRYPDLHRRLDVPEKAPIWITEDDNSSDRTPLPPLRVKSGPLEIQRLADRSKEAIDGILDWSRMTGRTLQLPAEDWTIDEIGGPNVTDKETILSFARMAANAYISEPHTGEWEDVGCGYNYTEDFGWESDGLRGHIFADTTNSTIVIGLKGTSPAVFDGSETTTNDKINDNLYFSCCCGQGGQFLWRQVCDCMTSTYTCNTTCVVSAIRAKNRYYSAARDLYHNVTALYPGSEVWLAGHSLGGAVASMLGLTYGHPALTFEAVPEAIAASRLGLPTPPGHQVGSMQKRARTGGYHFGHTADPVYMGQCNTATSSCTFGGYALQSVCHTGFKCVYDTVSDLGWRVGIGTHKIVNVIKDVLEKYDEPAKCEQYVDCTDCFPWQFYESNGTEPSSSTSSSSIASSTKYETKTRTETCKTPGWWGCLDEDEPTTTSSTSTSTTTSTSTCKTPGWFGCKDETEPSTTTCSSSTSATATPAPAPAPSITTTSSQPTSSASSSTSCKHPGWFGGCHDDDDDDVTPTSPCSSTSCKHPGWFGGCHDVTRTTTSASSTAQSSTLDSTTTSCTSKGFFGLICYDSNARVAGPVTAVVGPDDGEERMEM